MPRSWSDKIIGTVNKMLENYAPKIHVHGNYVPTWMAVMVIVLIAAAYLLAIASGIQINEPRAIGTLGIAAIVAICLGLNNKK